MAIGAAIGSVVGGVMNMKAASDQADMATSEAARADALRQQAVGALDESKVVREEQLDYAKQFESMLGDISAEYGDYASGMMQNFEDTFGSMRSNLTDYYENLDPTKYSTQAKAQIGKQIDTGMQQFDETAAQTGIYTSGMKLQAEKDASFKKAEAFAQADIAAPEHVMAMQENFYGTYGEPARQTAEAAQGQAILNQGTMAGIGYNASNSAREGIASMGSQYANIYTGQADSANASSAGYGQASGTNMGSGANMLASGASSLFNSAGSMGSIAGMFSDARLKTNIRRVGSHNGYSVFEWDWTKQAEMFVGDAPTIGVIAQDVAKTNPGAVNTAPNGFLMVNYEAL